MGTMIDKFLAFRKQAPRSLILAALMCTMMLAAMDTTIVSTAVPQIVGDLGGFRLFSWVFSVYLLAQTVTIPIYGKLSDQFGRKMVLMAGMTIFLIGSVACSLAWDMVSLIVFRGMQGLGAGAIMATVATLAGDLYTLRERGVVQGWLSSVWGVAAIAGPLLGGFFAEYVSWRWIFLVNVPVGALALLMLGLFLHERFERRKPQIDYLGSALVLLLIGTALFGLLQGGLAWAWLSVESGLIAAAVIILFIISIYVERRAAEPVMPAWIWRRRVLAGSNLATAGMGVVMMAPITYLPTLMQAVQGLGAIGAGMVLAAMSIGWPLASALSARAYLRIGFRDTALIGGVLVVLASVAFLLLPRPQPIWMVVADQLVLGAGFGLLFTPLLVGVQSTVGWEERGVVTGASMFSRNLGQSIGAALFGAIFNATLASRLAVAPAAVAAEMPDEVNGVIAAVHSAENSPAALDWLRSAIEQATWNLYLTMAVAGVLILGLLLGVARIFPIAEHDSGRA